MDETSRPKTNLISNFELTDLFLRYAGVLLFIKLLDQIDTFSISFYLTVVANYFEQIQEEPLKQFFWREWTLTLVFTILSIILVFFPQVVTKKIIKREKSIGINFTMTEIAKTVIIVSAIIWICYFIFFVFEISGYSIEYYAGLTNDEKFDLSQFEILRNIGRLFLAIILIRKSDKLGTYLERKITLPNSSHKI